MKKVLLGSTAILSAVMLSHGAMAQTAPAPAPTDQPVKLGISGFLQGGLLVNLKNNDGPGQTGAKHNPAAVQEYGLIDFSGDTKFANGIGAGAFIEFFAWSHTETNVGGATSQIKQGWVHLTGDSFGEVRVGDMTDVRRAQAVIAPEWAPDTLFSANSPDLAVNNSNGALVSNTTTACIGSCRATMVTYYTPTFSGFKFGVSYAPDQSKGNTGAAASSFVNAGATFRDEYSVTGTWSGNVGPVAISASAAITGASTKQNVVNTLTPFNANPLAYNAGAMMTSGPFSLGVSYEQIMNPNGFSEQINKTTDIGGTYTVGPYTFGAEYSSGSRKNVFGAKTGTPKLNWMTAGATYAVGPGVSVSGGLQFADYDSGGTSKSAVAVANGATSGYDGLTLLMGTDIKF